MPKFTRTKENFVCEHCGASVLGTGYTNHCPKCLFSKHVDVNPGDRAEVCGGLMRPVGYELQKGQYVLIHQCEKCGVVKRNKTAPGDSVDALIGLTKQP
ncbi:MAG: RNHCP domain-containing protein [Patescibacteria group bacterium]|nr:RNHCP domain-containing protein [Patescibacteria group bacterium]